MKIIFRTFLILFLSILLHNFTSIQTTNCVTETYVQNPTQKVVLVSENLGSQVEIFSKNDQNNQNFLNGRTPFVNSNRANNNKLLGETQKIANVNIHKLSANKLSINYIRAP